MGCATAVVLCTYGSFSTCIYSALDVRDLHWTAPTAVGAPTKFMNHTMPTATLPRTLRRAQVGDHRHTAFFYLVQQ